MSQHEDSNYFLEILLELYRKELGQVKFNKLVEKTVKIGYNYLVHKHGHFLSKYTDVYSDPHYVAANAVAPLFIDRGNNYPIVRSFESWDSEIKTEADALTFLTKIVSNRIEQFLIKLLKEQNPLLGKILDSVNYYILKNDYKKKKIYGKTYILRDVKEAYSYNLMPSEEFYNINVRNIGNAGEVLKFIFNHLEAETDYSIAIPIYDVVNLIEMQSFAVANQDDKHFSYQEEIITIDNHINKALLNSKRKLVSSYQQKSKISEVEMSAIHNALKDICDDLRNGGINTSLYEYLSTHISELDHQKYLTKYRNIFEYIYKYMRNDLIKSLAEDK